MKTRIILAACLLLAGCKTARRPLPGAGWTVEGYDAAGNLTSRTVNATGQQAAAGGAAQDSGASKVAEKLAEKATGEFGYISLVRSAVDQPDSAVELQLVNDHKAAAQAYAKALEGGASGNVVDAIAKTVQAASAQIADYRKAKAMAPKPDTSGISITAFLSGEDANETLGIMGGTFGATLQAKERAQATLKTSETQTDTTSTNDWRGITAIAELKMQLAIEKMKREIAEAKAAVKPTAPAPAVTNSTGGATNAASPEARADEWYPDLPRGGGNSMAVYAGVGETFLWKPTSDSNGKAAVHTPNSLRIRSLTVAGDESEPGSVGNGWRPLFRLPKAGAAYGSNVAVVLNLADGSTVPVTVPNGGERYEAKGLKPGSVEPQPGATNAVTKAVSSGGILRLPADINARAIRVQVIHTRNSDAPAYDVSGATGVGVENGFQWVNLGWNAEGVYNAGKALAQFPVGSKGPAVWLVTCKPGMGGEPFGADGNLVVEE